MSWCFSWASLELGGQQLCSSTRGAGSVGVHGGLHVVGVLCQVVLQSAGQRQVLDLLRDSVNGDPTQVLQRGRGSIHRCGQQQLHRAVGRRPSGLRARRHLAAASAGQLDVVLHQVDHAVELL